MKKICVVGHFGTGKKMLNGQTVKTKILTEELKKQFGEENVVTIDTHGGKRVLLRLFLNIFKALQKCENIIILPANNGVKIIPYLIEICNVIYHRKLHYDVIGGWLPDLLKKNQKLVRVFSKYSGIYVETEAMKSGLNGLGLHNVFVIPNCKNLEIIPEELLVSPPIFPVKLCTFSRVMKEKGIEEAVRVINSLNSKSESGKYELDIYGQIDSNQTEWFADLQKNFSSQIRYCGLVDFDKSTSVLKKYHALLFPTFYSGEGFAGTIIDAMAAGIPVLASDWKYNSEVIIDGYNGMLFETHNEEKLKNLIKKIDSNSDEYKMMKINCVRCAKKYLPSVALKPLFERL